MVFVCCQMSVSLFQKHRVKAETDQISHSQSLQLLILVVSSKFYQRLVDLGCKHEANDSNAVVHHLVWRRLVECQLIVLECQDVLANVSFSQSTSLLQVETDHPFEDQRLH